ncbi:hypothetical protein GCM10009000_041680 [Halobacterium noricense]
MKHCAPRERVLFGSGALGDENLRSDGCHQKNGEQKRSQRETKPHRGNRIFAESTDPERIDDLLSDLYEVLHDERGCKNQKRTYQ